jgi:hypothetical protein
MAHPGELVRAVADILGIDVATVAHQDRLLAEGKFRQTGGRGRSAPHMSPKDAACLLIAAVAPPLAGPPVRETIQTLRTYAALKARLSPRFNPFGDAIDERGDWSRVAVLRELAPGHSLLSALTAMIAGFMAGRFDIADKVWGPENVFVRGGEGSDGPVLVDARGARVAVQVSFMSSCSEARSEILIQCIGHSELEDELAYEPLPSKLPRSTRRRTDLIQTATISAATFRAIADLLKQDRQQ